MEERTKITTTLKCSTWIDMEILRVKLGFKGRNDVIEYLVRFYNEQSSKGEKNENFNKRNR